MTIYTGTVSSTDGRTLDVEIVDPQSPPPDPDPDPDPDEEQPAQLVVPAGANTVVVVGTERQFPLAYVDPGDRNAYPAERGAGEAGLYTAAGWPHTHLQANEYGWDVQLSADGSVVGSYRSSLAPGTILPANGGVLTGHETGAPGSAGAFVKSLRVGDRVAFQKLEVTTPPVPGPRSGAFPTWVVSSYWQQYQGPDMETALARMPGYNVVFAAFATGGGGQEMTFSPRTYAAYSGTGGEDRYREHLAAWRASGRVTGLSFGGGVDASAATVIQSEAHAAAVYSKLAPIIDRYGFTAIDCDMENGPQGFTRIGLASLYRRLRAQYGKDFGLSVTPRPYEDFYYDIAGALYAEGLLDLCQHQFYDAKETRDNAFLQTWIPGRVQNAVNRGVPVGIQAVGSITWTGYPYGWNTSDNYLTAVRKIPGIRGVMNWELSLDLKMGGEFAAKAAALAPVMGAGA